MNRAEIQAAKAYPLASIARELNTCSPELRNLIRLALSDADKGQSIPSEMDREMAGLRLSEAVSSWTDGRTKPSSVANFSGYMSRTDDGRTVDEALQAAVPYGLPKLPPFPG